VTVQRESIARVWDHLLCQPTHLPEA